MLCNWKALDGKDNSEKDTNNTVRTASEYGVSNNGQPSDWLVVALHAKNTSLRLIHYERTASHSTQAIAANY